MSLFAAQSARMLAAVAGDLGCEVEALQSHALTVVPRPVPASERLVALAIDTGMGTVLSVEPALVDWARGNAPTDRHFRALQPFFLADLAQQARVAGFAGARPHGFSLGFALDHTIIPGPLPHGHRLVTVDRAWMDRYRPTNEFDNALGEPDETDRFEKTRTAFAVLDIEGEPAAVAAVWDHGHGREEIGVDVRRNARGLGLAKVVVHAATEDVLRGGRIPFYSCGATNIRSHRNALACGFLPLYATAIVWCPPA
jgi:Acetyltransferase (GNAT) family